MKKLFLHLNIFLENEESNPGKLQNLSAAMPKVVSYHFPVENMLRVWVFSPGTKRRSVKLVTVQN